MSARPVDEQQGVGQLDQRALAVDQSAGARDDRVVRGVVVDPPVLGVVGRGGAGEVKRVNVLGDR